MLTRTHTHTYMCAHASTHIHTLTHIHTRARTRTGLHTYTYTHLHTHTRTLTYTHTYTHARTSAHTHTYTHNTHILTHTLHTHAHTYKHEHSKHAHIVTRLHTLVAHTLARAFAAYAYRLLLHCKLPGCALIQARFRKKRTNTQHTCARTHTHIHTCSYARRRTAGSLPCNACKWHATPTILNITDKFVELHGDRCVWFPFLSFCLTCCVGLTRTVYVHRT